MKRNDITVKSAMLLGVAVLSLMFFASQSRRPIYRSYTGHSYPPLGVSLFWEPDVVVVRVDDREERVPKSQLATTPIYQEAIARLPRSDRPALTEVRWIRVLRYWIPLTALSWWLLFRVWQPPRPYIEGGSVS
jgi:hypothetical protein